MHLFPDIPLFAQFIVAMAFGLIVGSFLNVVIYRVPRAESVAFPASHCGSCGANVKPYDNIPVLSYLILGGKCRFCKASYSWIYPAVELLVGLLFLAVVYWNDGITTLGIAQSIFIAILVALIFIDAKHLLLPDVITYPALLFCLLAIMIVTYFNFANDEYLQPISAWLPEALSNLSVTQWLSFIAIALAIPALWLVDKLEDILFSKYHEFDDEDETAAEAALNVKWEQQTKKVVKFVLIFGLLAQAAWWIAFYKSPQLLPHPPASHFAAYALTQAVIGALVGGGTLWLLRAAFFYIRGIEGMGLGDIKLMAFIGAFMGWQQTLLILLLSTLLGTIVGGAAALISRKGLKLRMPFGVPIGISAIIALFYGQQMLRAYLSQFQ